MHRAALAKKVLASSDRLTLSDHLYRSWVQQFTFSELEKDLGEKGDITTSALFPETGFVHATVEANEGGILAGGEEVRFFLQNRLEFEFLKADGETITPKTTIIRLKGNLKTILEAERVLLNVLGRMSGVATMTHRIVEKVKTVNPNVLVTPTRKTLWGLLDKRACLLGGAGTHRLNLSDAVLIKDNHLHPVRRDIPTLIQKFSRGIPESARFLEVEVNSPEEALTAASEFQKLQASGICKIPCIVMLDNAPPLFVSKAVDQLKQRGFYDTVLIEASGGITEWNIVEYAQTGVDIISMGVLTKSPSTLDFSLDITIPSDAGGREK